MGKNLKSNLGSGLAITGAAVLVVVAGVMAYYVMSNNRQIDAGTEQLAIAQEQPEAAKVQPEPVKVQPEPAIEQPAPAPDVTTGPAPSFDLVRVDKSGSTVVAGRAAANTHVSILMDGEIIGSTKTDTNGAFVVLLDIPPSDAPRELGLVQGEDLVSNDKVLVMPFKPEAASAPDLILAKPNGVEFIAQADSANAPAAETGDNASAEAKSDGLSLDTIVYDDLGDVVISGRGNSEDFVRIYLDNKPAETQKVPDDGQWKVTLPDVPDGLYALRVDSLNAEGNVIERVQSPFKREAAQVVEASTLTGASNVTIQPGYTLWALAEKRYGDGVRYVQIFEANRDHIKDPDLIYPGQIFDLPD